MKIYMDACCWKRPFDDLSQDLVYLEAEAILSIISRCESGEWVLVASGIIDFELSLIRDAGKAAKVQNLYRTARERFLLDTESEKRAKFFQQNGLKAFDSLHLAVAETRGADIFLTTDNKLLRAAKKLKLNIIVSNPLTYLMEILNNE